MSHALLPKKLQQLIAQLQQLSIATQTETAALHLAQPLIQQLVQHPDWLPNWVYDRTKLQQGEAAYVLNHPPDDGFMLLLIAWESGIDSCVHDHATWSIVGLVEGQETIYCYTLDNTAARRSAPPPQQRYHLLPQPSIVLNPGDICATDASAIHQVANTSADKKLSISLHLYGADLRETTRYIYDPATDTRSPNPNSEFILL